MISYLFPNGVDLVRLKNNLQRTWRQYARANGREGRLLSQGAAAKQMGLSQPAFSRRLSPMAMTEQCLAFILAFAKLVGRKPDELLPELSHTGGHHG